MAGTTTPGAQANTDSAAGTTTQQQTPAATGATTTTETPAGEKPAGEAAAAQTDQGTTATEPGSTAGAAETTPKAPEKYELRVPEGGERYFGQADLEYVETIARASNWTQEDAQAEIDDAFKRTQAREQAQHAAFLEAAKADREYGGEQFDTTRQLAQRVIDRVRPEGHGRRDGFLRFIQAGGADKHIEVLSFLADLGRAMSEDTPGHQRPSGSASTGDAASKLYDHPTSKAQG